LITALAFPLCDVGAAPQEQMLARPLVKTDYDHIVSVIDKWSGGPSAVLAHPVFFHELGKLAKVVEYEHALVGFLFGFISEREPKQGYIHLFGIHSEFRRRGVGRMLFEAFEQDSKMRGCGCLRSITLPGNDNVVSFHQSLGWTSTLVEDYAGPERPRIVFEKRL
jgi:ribosomal protein S18 acetylase RimI-like enzyme